MNRDVFDTCVLLKGDGFHPAPVDLENVTLSRELQVCDGFGPYYLLSHYCEYIYFKKDSSFCAVLKGFTMHFQTPESSDPYVLVENTFCPCFLLEILIKNYSCLCAYQHCLQSMVETVAENYHNIWAKKKKLELSSKGSIVFLETYLYCLRFFNSPHKLCFYLQEVGLTHCWYPMTH